MNDAPKENYYRVGSSIWREFTTDDTRLMAAYLLTCSHRTTEGLFVLPMGYAAADLDWKEARALRAFVQVAGTDMVRYDDSTRCCLIVNALKWQAPVNPNQVKAAIKKLIAIPDTDLFEDFYRQAEQFAKQLLEPLREAFPKRFCLRLVEQSGEHSNSSSNSNSSSTAAAAVAGGTSAAAAERRTG